MTRTERERAESAVFSANVRAELGRQHMSQKKLSATSGIDIDALRRRLGGRAVWTGGELNAVARALGVPVGILMAGTEPETS